MTMLTHVSIDDASVALGFRITVSEAGLDALLASRHGPRLRLCGLNVGICRGSAGGSESEYAIKRFKGTYALETQPV